MLTKERVLELGFKELPHFTIQDSLMYDLGRNRELSIACIGTPNEMLFISETNEKNNKVIDELIVLSNCDFDGYLTEKKVSLLLTFFAKNKYK